MASKLAIVGAAGRMGKYIINLAVQSGQFDIVGAVERADHPDIGKDAGSIAGIESIGIELSGALDVGADVVIDFSSPEVADGTIDYCIENNVALVMGTTGLSDSQHKKIVDAYAKIPVVYGTNMSVGMNVLFNLVGKAAAMLGEDYDIEIVEQHHRFKKDAPSGSALTLAENICKATSRDFPASLVNGRSGGDEVRQKGTIGMHAVRAGDITGIHSVMFGTLGEKVTLSHTAHSRNTFASGALRAAEWLVGKKSGKYSMADVLGI
jgi:4-hydroxy-tetrahydrodipicolinate reductase